MAIASKKSDKRVSTYQEKNFGAEKTDVEVSFKIYEEKLSKAERNVQELYINLDVVDQLGKTPVNVERKLNSYKKHDSI